MEIINRRDLRIESFQLSRWEVNSYIIVSPETRQSVLIDVPPGALTLLKNLEDTDLKYILLTHSHIDHIAGLPAFMSRRKAPLAIHPADQGWLQTSPDQLLNDGEIVTVGNIKIKVLYTPGHTPGSVCFLIDKYLISGDTIFPGGPGRTETPENFQQELKAIREKILVLPEEMQIYPGHGDPTTLKKAKEEYDIFASRRHDPGLCGDVTWLGS